MKVMLPGRPRPIKRLGRSGLIRAKKPPRYREFGVPEYWVVDPDERLIEAYRLAEGAMTPHVRSDRVTWQPGPNVPALDITLPEIFADF